MGAMAATSASPASSDTTGKAAPSRWGAVAAAAAALLVFTNGPVLLFSKHVLDRTGRWEDHAVWPFLAAAALCGAALATRRLLTAGGQQRDPASPGATAAVVCFALAAVASTLWSVDPSATAWRSSIYVGMALLAWAVAGLDHDERAAVLATVAGAAVVASLLLVWLRPDLGLDANDDWKGVYTNRNSLGPLAAIGVLASVRYLLAPGRWRRAAAGCLTATSTAALIGAGSRTAWIALAVAVVTASLVAAVGWLRSRLSASHARSAAVTATGLGAAGAAGVLVMVWDVPTFDQRREMWRLVWDRIVERPTLGHGFFTFWNIEELTQHALLRRGSAHNSLIEVGLGLGLLGLVPFAVILFLAARNAGLALWRRPGPDTWAGAALVAFLLLENLAESFVLWFSYSWVLLMAAALRPAPAADQPISAALDRAPSGTGIAPSSKAVARTDTARGLARLRSGWTAVALISLAMLALWLPDLNLPLGNSDDGRIVAFSGLHARNFWDLGPVESAWGARVDPFVRPEFGVAPRSDPPVAAVTYAHHPPLKDWMSTASAGLFGQNLPALRIPSFLTGAATLAFMASLLRACRLRWGSVLLAVGAMGSTGFFYVYGRLGVSFSMLLAATATVAWLRRTERPPRWALAGAGLVAALCAMQSWVGLASLGPLLLWLYADRLRRGKDASGVHPEPSRPGPATTLAAPERARSRLGAYLARGWSPALTALVIGTAAGAAVTAGWMLNANGFAELVDQVIVRISTDVTSGGQTRSFTFGEFLERQWSFATSELMVPQWLRVLLLPALLASLIDRRTRVPAAITLAVAAAMTFGLPHGAWIHRLWNFPWLMPVTIGLASLLDGARRLVPSRWRIGIAIAGAAVIAATVVAVAAGGTRDRYIADPAHLGEALEQAAATPEARSAELVWTGPGLAAPRWASYYFDVPVWDLEESRLDGLVDSDLVILMASRTPEFLPDGALSDPLASVGDFRVTTAASLTR